MTNIEFKMLKKKAYHPSKLTDKELARLRRSSRTNSKLLSKIVKEQEKRGLLKKDYNGSGYAPEIKKNVKDY
jgi:hypothetical protein